MQWATFLAGASAAFASFSDVKHDPLTQIIGLLIIPFAIGIIIHAVDQCELVFSPLALFFWRPKGFVSNCLFLFLVFHSYEAIRNN